MVFVNHLSPYVFSFEMAGRTLGLRWYGLAYVLGFVLGYLALRQAARQGRVPGLTQEGLDRLIFALIIGVVGGGRLGYVLQNLGQWAQDPLFLFRVWEGGMAFFGGLIGVLLATAWAARRDKLSFWALTDALTLPAALGLAVGRIANFINAELWGRPTGRDWGVIYPTVDQQLRHPYELYSSVSLFLLAGLLAWLQRRWGVNARAGLLSAVFLIGYGLSRTLTDFWREEPIFFAGMDLGQILSLVIAAIGWGLWLRWTKTSVSAQR